MAPLSILPGRIRVHEAELHGRAAACQRFESMIASIKGVLAVAANHRTGRVLVHFDETVLDRQQLARELASAVVAAEEPVEPNTGAGQSLPLSSGNSRGKSYGMGSHLLRDAVAHILLPSPLDLLLPTAFAVLRR